MKYIIKILQALKEISFFFKPKKYEFYIIEVEFLKFIIKLNNIYIFKKKIKIIKF